MIGSADNYVKRTGKIEMCGHLPRDHKEQFKKITFSEIDNDLVPGNAHLLHFFHFLSRKQLLIVFHILLSIKKEQPPPFFST